MKEKLLRKIERYADKNLIPICGPLKGRFLKLLAKTIKAKKILELGTGIGYSTIWLESSIPKGGKVISIDIDKSFVKVAKKNLKKGNALKRVKILNGDARKEIKKLEEKFDLIFIDIVKSQYSSVFESCVSLLKDGGILVADDSSWEDVKEYNEKALKDDRLETIILPIDGGMTVSIKKRSKHASKVKRNLSQLT
jgi:predicted O-methyltransferase YrrM